MCLKMKLLEAISNHIGTVWYLQTKNVVNVIFMKCVLYLIFLIMLLTLILLAACHFLSVFNLYIV